MDPLRGAGVRQRLMIPTILFTGILAAVIVLIVLSAQSGLRDREGLLTVQRTEAVKQAITSRAEQARTFVGLVAMNAPVAEAMASGKRSVAQRVLTQFPRKRSLAILALYDAQGHPFAAAAAGGTERPDTALANFLASALSARAPLAGIVPVDGKPAFVAAQAVRRNGKIVGTALSGEFVNDWFLSSLGNSAGASVALHQNKQVVASAREVGRGSLARFRETSIRASEADLWPNWRAVFILLEDDAAAIAEEMRSLAVVVGAIVLAALSTIAMSVLAIRSVTRSEKRLQHEATHDALTGLANRRMFSSALQDRVELYRTSPNAKYAVLYIDLDHFKFVNDSLGHEIGDEVLVETSRRITTATRDRDLVSRLGGDEFAVLLSPLRDDEDALRVLERVQSALSAPLQIADRTIFTTASIGITYGSPQYVRGEDLLRDADAALYRAKHLGRARHVVFDRSMLTTARMRLELDSDLRMAQERNELRLVYQPIFDLGDGFLVGWEALLRWNHPKFGAVSPADFVPIAEETGIILPIGNWVVDEACRQLAEWREQFPEFANGKYVAVNFSARQIVQPDLDQRLAAILGEYALEGSALRIEITESVIIDGARLDPAMFDRVKSLGCHLSIDDFGTGYSSLTYLQRYPVDVFKIDRSFVSGNGIGLHSPQIVSTLLRLGDSLSLAVVAEGVETPEQLASLREFGCRYAQGNLLSLPLEKADVPFVSVIPEPPETEAPQLQQRTAVS